MIPSAEYTHECTSWLVFPDLTKNNSCILHKNRDSPSKDIVIHRSPEGAPRRWIATGDYSCWSVNSGMNASGLAAAVNSGELCTDNSTNPKGKTTPEILKAVLDGCDTASQAVALVRRLAEAGDYYHGDRGSIFLFMDLNEAYILEMTAHFCSVQAYAHGYAYRANIWHHPDMAPYSTEKAGHFMNSCGRECMVRTMLTASLQANGRLSLQDMLALSRSTRLPDTQLDHLVCNKTTVSASTLEVDREFPAVLSTAYICVAHPRHTIYMPVPVCAEHLDERVHTPVLAKAAFARFDELGNDAEIPAAWLDYEKHSLADYLSARENARAALRAGKTPEAVALVNSASQTYITGAAALLGV